MQSVYYPLKNSSGNTVCYVCADISLDYMRYKQVFNWLQEFWTAQGNLSPLTSHPSPLKTLHIIGGGSLNKYLNQFTANATGATVLAGPQEGTAIGNIMLQAKAAGLVSDIWAMRSIIANSIDLVRYEPQDTNTWEEAYIKFQQITG